MQVFLVLLLLFFASGAQAADIFVIDNIMADKAANSPTAARNLAIEDAQQQGFNILINMLTDPNARKALPKLTPQGISAMVKSFEITEEKINGNEYQARFNIFYDEPQIKEFLSQYKVDVLVAKSPPILVLPVFTTGDTAILWEPENPWRKAWRQALNTPSEINLIVPMGDAEDIQKITAADLKAKKFDELLAFANKYGAREVMVAEAFFVENGKILVTRLQPVGPSPTLANLKDFQQQLDTSGAGFWEQSVASLQQKILEQWSAKGGPLESLSSKHIAIIVGLENPEDWLNIKSKLESVPTIANMELRELSITRAVIDVVYSGSFSKFQEALAKQKLDLLQEGGDLVLRKVPE